MRRRTFLAGGLATGLTVAFTACSRIPVFPKRPEPTVDTATGWISFRESRYQLIMPRIEIGQNVTTALKQIACDELDIPWDALTVLSQNTADIDRVKSTVGSESIKDFAEPLAQACASLRLAVEAGQTDGPVTATKRPIENLRSLSKRGHFVGQKIPLQDGDRIVTGAPLYAADVRRPNMIFGRVLRAPVSAELGSKPVAWNDARARRVKGFVGIVADAKLKLGSSIGLGILAKTPAALDRISEALNVQWEIEGAFERDDVDDTIDIDARLATGSLDHTIKNNIEAEPSEWDVDVRIDIPLAAHGSIEPRCAVADLMDTGQMHVWTGVQDLFFQRDSVAKELGLPTEDVVVFGQRVGGAFGGKMICTVELEAALLARAAECPVKVQWTREQEYQLGFHRPPSSHRIRAKLQENKIDTWWHGFASSHILFTNAAMPRWLQQITDFVGDPGVARGADHDYRIPTQRIEFDLHRLPVFTGAWRGLGAGPNMLAIESAIDECAVHAGVDPLDFRLSHIDDRKLRRVFETVATSADWKIAPQVRDGYRIGTGIAGGIYKKSSYAAVCAEVRVSPNGIVSIQKLWCAHDCGLIINPDQVRAQCEGNLVWGIGMVLSDHLSVAASRVAAQTFADAPIPRMTDVPSMHIDLIDGNHPPTGAGETVIVAAAGAIANAIRNATGIRPTHFPVKPEELAQSKS